MFNDLVAVILFLMPFGTKIMFWLIYRYFVKKKNKVYCENEVANYECSRITKYYYSLALVAAAYIDSAAMLMLQYSYMKECNAWTFVMTVFFILASYRKNYKSARKEAKTFSQKHHECDFVSSQNIFQLFFKFTKNLLIKLSHSI